MGEESSSVRELLQIINHLHKSHHSSLPTHRRAHTRTCTHAHRHTQRRASLLIPTSEFVSDTSHFPKALLLVTSAAGPCSLRLSVSGNVVRSIPVSLPFFKECVIQLFVNAFVNLTAFFLITPQGEIIEIKFSKITAHGCSQLPAVKKK